MKNLFFPLIVILSISTNIYSQVSQSFWVYSNSSASDIPQAMVIDKDGNVIVTGSSPKPPPAFGDNEYTTIKYNFSGTQQWVKRYDGTDNDTLYDEPLSIASDRNGNIYVTGRSPGNGTGFDILTIKYDPAGVEKWVRRYNGSANKNDRGRLIVADSSGFVYVGGYVNENNPTKGIIIKYDSLGNQIWANVQDSAVNFSMSCDPSNNLYITFNTIGLLRIVRFNPNGTELWRKYFSDNYYSGILLEPDRFGNLFVAGRTSSSTSASTRLIKFNSSGNVIWSKSINPFNNGCQPLSLNSDGNGDVLIGTNGNDTAGFNRKFLAFKYSSSGNFMWNWVLQWDPNDGAPPSGKMITTDNNNNVFVVTDYTPVATNLNTLTYCLNGTNGTLQWEKNYGGAGGDIDQPVSVKANANGVYILDNSATTSGSFETDFVTIRYYDFVLNSPQNGAGIPSSYSLYQNFPNPFNPVTNIKFDIHKAGNVKLTLYNSIGMEVETIVDEFKLTGQYSINFNAKDFSSGIYFYKLAVNDFSETKKMILLK